MLGLELLVDELEEQAERAFEAAIDIVDDAGEIGLVHVEHFLAHVSHALIELALRGAAAHDAGAQLLLGGHDEGTPGFGEGAHELLDALRVEDDDARAFFSGEINVRFPRPVEVAMHLGEFREALFLHLLIEGFFGQEVVVGPILFSFTRATRGAGDDAHEWVERGEEPLHEFGFSGPRGSRNDDD